MNTKTVVLQDLICESKDGEWGKSEPFDSSVEMIVVRSTDFEDVQAGRVDAVPRRFIPPAIAARKMMRRGDIIIETAGGGKDRPTGRTQMLRDNFLERASLPIICASFCRFLRIDQTKAYPQYIYWHLQFLYATGIMKQFHTQHTGVARFQYTTFATTQQLEIPASLATQRKIAAILSAYDDLIENNTRRIAILESIAQAIYREWFVEFRFPGHERAGDTNTPERQLPDGWRRIMISDYVRQGLVQLQTGPFGTQLKASEYTACGSPVINVCNIGYGDIRKDKLEHLPESVVNRLSVHILKTGDIVFGRKGAVDRHVLVTPAEEGWIQGSDCIRLRCVTEHVCSYFLSFAFREQSHHNWMLQQCSNMTTMASLNQDVIGRIPIICPPEEVLRKFREFSSDVIQQIGTLKRQSANARQTRDLLLPKLITGELDVEELSIETPETLTE